MTNYEKKILADAKKVDDMINEIHKQNPNLVSVKGNAVTGDEVIFIIDIWGGTYRKPTHNGFEIIEGVIIADSYGKGRGQHTFTIRKIDGSIIRKKGRNLYKHEVLCKNYYRESRGGELEGKYNRAESNEAVRLNRGI